MRDPDVDFYKATLHLTDPAAAPVNEGSITYDVDGSPQEDPFPHLQR